jgi:hypothetical protein
VVAEAKPVIMEQNSGKIKPLAVDFVLGTAALRFASARHPDGPPPKYRRENEQEQNIHRYSPFESNAPPTKHVTPLSAKPTMRQTEAQGAPSANMSVTSPITPQRQECVRIVHRLPFA